MLKISHIFVTPEMAKEILAKRNVNNYRKLKPNAAKLYEKDMREGKWVENGDTITFDTNGNLMNGQHRCMAIANSGIGQWCIFVEGLDPECAKTIDIGFKRSVEDYLKRAEPMYKTGATSIVRLSMSLRRGNRYSGQSSANAKISNMDIIDEYQENKDHYDVAITIAQEIAKQTKKVLKQTYVGAIYYYLVYVCGVDTGLVKEFFYRFTEMKPKDNNIYSKTYDLLSDKDKIGRSGVAIVNAYIKCWNNHVLNSGKTNLVDYKYEWFVLPDKKGVITAPTAERVEVPMCI